VDLVEELPSGLPPTKPFSHWTDDWMSQVALPDWDEMRSVWEGDDAVDCANVCRQLQQEQIPYTVDQSILSREARMRVNWKYQILVPSEDYRKAREAMGYEEGDGEEQPDEGEYEAAMELPARDDLPVEDVHGDWDPRNWYPEDATTEVWSGNPKESGSIVEMSLKENRINYRVALEGDELKRVFVMPEDEARAREIVREVVEGAPPV